MQENVLKISAKKSVKKIYPICQKMKELDLSSNFLNVRVNHLFFNYKKLFIRLFKKHQKQQIFLQFLQTQQVCVTDHLFWFFVTSTHTRPTTKFISYKTKTRAYKKLYRIHISDLPYKSRFLYKSLSFIWCYVLSNSVRQGTNNRSISNLISIKYRTIFEPEAILKQKLKFQPQVTQIRYAQYLDTSSPTLLFFNIKVKSLGRTIVDLKQNVYS